MSWSVVSTEDIQSSWFRRREEELLQPRGNKGHNWTYDWPNVAPKEKKREQAKTFLENLGIVLLFLPVLPLYPFVSYSDHQSTKKGDYRLGRRGTGERGRVSNVSRIALEKGTRGKMSSQDECTLLKLPYEYVISYFEVPELTSLSESDAAIRNLDADINLCIVFEKRFGRKYWVG